MKHTRRNAFKILGLVLALGGTALLVAAHGHDDDGFRAGHIFTSTNAVAGNELRAYAALRDFVVNALSNSVSTFAIRRHGLVLRSMWIPAVSVRSA